MGCNVCGPSKKPILKIGKPILFDGPKYDIIQNRQIVILRTWGIQVLGGFKQGLQSPSNTTLHVPFLCGH